MYCTHRIYKGEDIVFTVPLPEDDFTEFSIYFYTQGEEKVQCQSYEIEEGVIFCYFTGDELDILPDGVVRYDMEYTVGGETQIQSIITDKYLATPGGYSALTPDDYYQSGYTAGYEAAQAQSVNLTQEEYDALENPLCDTYYNIVEE